MPLVRFPLVSLLRLSDGLKALTERSKVVLDRNLHTFHTRCMHNSNTTFSNCQVVADLIREALKLQMLPKAAEANFTPAKHPLLVDDDTVPRAKRRKRCKNDAVARVDADALFAAAL